MNDAAFDALIDATFGKAEANATKRVRETERRRRSRLHWLFADADTQAGIRDTAWAGYQAVAEYVDHYAPVRTKADEHTARAARVLTSRSEEHTSELQSLMHISYAVFCLQKK